MTAKPSTIASAYWRTKPDWILRKPSALLRIRDRHAGDRAVDHPGLHDGLVEVGHRGEGAPNGRVVEVVPVPDVLEELRLVLLADRKIAPDREGRGQPEQGRHHVDRGEHPLLSRRGGRHRRHVPEHRVQETAQGRFVGPGQVDDSPRPSPEHSAPRGARS